MATPKHRYSPLPPDDYSRTTEGLRFGYPHEISLRPEWGAFWNLYWLSEWQLPTFANSHALLDPEIFQACLVCVEHQSSGGVPIKRLLCDMTPLEFVAHIRSYPHKRLAPYKLMGSYWFRNMENQARMWQNVPLPAGNVIQVNFKKRLSKTKRQGSAIIMPLSLEKRDG